MEILIHFLQWYDNEAYDNYEVDGTHYEDWLSDYRDTYPEQYQVLMEALSHR